jgi:thiol-disulfide isomerase/thioredoxin
MMPVRPLVGIILLSLVLSNGLIVGDAGAEDPGMQPLGPGDFTHFVLGEQFTATWCGYCPTAAHQLEDIYYNDGYEFYYVALIGDVNDKASDRMGDYPTATGYPTVEFDGGYREETGAQSDKTAYEQAIEESGARSDTPVSAEVQMSWEGDSAIRVTARARWDEDGTIINPTLQTHIRVYITEIDSRYQHNDGGNYRFGFLDYAFDQDLDLEPNTWWEEEVVWVGSDHQDSNGDDFGDIDYANIAIIATVFNDESSDSDKYALQTDGTIAPKLMITSPGNNETFGGDFTLDVTSSGSHESGDPTGITSVEYSIDNGTFTSLSPGSGDEYSGEVDTSGLENGEHSILIRSTDDKGTTTDEHMIFQLDGEDVRGPSIDIVSPADNASVKGVLAINVDVIDESEISSVQYRIDDGTWTDMGSGEGSRFSADWDSGEVEDGQHSLTITASDVHGNSDEGAVSVNIDNAEDDTIPPELEIEAPASDEELRDTVLLKVHASDEYGIDSVSFSIDEGAWTDLTYESDDLFTHSLDTTTIPNGDHVIDFLATDSSGNERSADVEVTVSNVADTESPIISPVTPGNHDILSLAEERMDVLVHVSDNEGVNKIECSFDSGPWRDMEYDDDESDSSGKDIYRFDYRSLHDEIADRSDGDYILEFRAVDDAGNTEEISIDLTIDNTPPIVSDITVDPEAGVIDEPLKFSATVQDGSGVDSVNLIYEFCQGDVCLRREVESMKYKSGDGAYHYTTTFDEEGTVKYHIEAEDDVGNIIETDQEHIEIEAQDGGSDGEDQDDEDPEEEIKLPSGVLITSLVDGATVSDQLMLEGAAYSSKIVTVGIDGQIPITLSTRPATFSQSMDDFTLTDLDGNGFTLSDHEGKVVILDFMATWCTGCKSLADNLKAIHDIYGDSVVIVTIDTDSGETEEELKEFGEAHGASWAHAFDTAGLANKYGIQELPRLMFITPDQDISWEFSGVPSVAELEVQIGLAYSDRVWSHSLDTTSLTNGYHTLTVSIGEGSDTQTMVFLVENEESSSTNDDGDDGIDSIYLMGISSLLVIIIIIAAVLVMNRSGEEEESYYCYECSDELSYIDDYDAWYCDECEEYR